MRPARLRGLIAFIAEFKRQNPTALKAGVQRTIERNFAVLKQRSVYKLEDGALRVSEANVGSFSNVVLSLSTLRKYDDLPIVVAVVRPEAVEFLLANSTFLKRVSHSSQRLAVNNIRGSFLGHDILREFDGIKNSPENFDALLSLHQGVTWDENLVRLVESTTAIVPTGKRQAPDEPWKPRIDPPRVLNESGPSKRVSVEVLVEIIGRIDEEQVHKAIREPVDDPEKISADGLVHNSRQRNRPVEPGQPLRERLPLRLRELYRPVSGCSFPFRLNSHGSGSTSILLSGRSNKPSHVSPRLSRM